MSGTEGIKLRSHRKALGHVAAFMITAQ